MDNVRPLNYRPSAQIIIKVLWLSKLSTIIIVERSDLYLRLSALISRAPKHFAKLVVYTLGSRTNTMQLTIQLLEVTSRLQSHDGMDWTTNPIFGRCDHTSIL